MARAPGNSSAIVSCPNGSVDVRKSVVRSLAIFCRAAFLFSPHSYIICYLFIKKFAEFFKFFFAHLQNFLIDATQRKKMRRAMIDGEIDFTEEAS